MNTNRNRRGSALMLTYFAAVVLSFVVVYGFRSSLDAGTTSNAVAVTEQADYAAEYGANLAVSLLSMVDVTNNLTTATVNRDWVEAGIYDDSVTKGKDQRRIAGTLGDYDFRVQVRSAGLALANRTMPDSWLSGTSGNRDSDKLLDYKNTYEILATARRQGFSGAESGSAAYTATEAYTAKVYGIVGMEFGDNPAGLNDPYTTYNADQGSLHIGVDTAFVEHESGVGPGNSAGDSSSQNQNHATDLARPSEDVVAATFAVDGEDHLLNTVYPRMTLSSSKTEVITAQRGQLEKSGQSITATGGYWASGNLTLNYMEDDRTIRYEDIPAAKKHRGVYTPARPNPYVPLTRGFDKDKAEDKRMASKYERYAYSGNKWKNFYDDEYYANKIDKELRLSASDRLTVDTMPVDKYFLGGKNVDGGRSVTLKTFDGVDVYSKAANALDEILYKGVQVASDKKGNKTYSGVIAQTKNSEFIAIDDPESTLDVLVGSYAELKRFYITYVNGDPWSWRTVFVGEWTGIKKAPGNASSVEKVLFDHGGGEERRRSFSKHYPMNKDGKILVHEMKWAKLDKDGYLALDAAGNVVVDETPGQSGKARVWTGRYKWVKPYFGEKYTVKDTNKNGRIVYPREFTWEEITGQTTKRIPSGDGSGTSVTRNAATYEAEIDADGTLVSVNRLKNSVRIEGYPVTDVLGREVPKVEVEGGKAVFDKDGNPVIVPIGLTEYCSVDAGKPEDLIPVYFAKKGKAKTITERVQVGTDRKGKPIYEWRSKIVYKETDDAGIDMYGVPEAVQSTGTGSPLSAYKSKNRQFARRNYIEVVEDDGSIRCYDDISDFEYLSDVTLEDGTIQKNRRVATIAIGMEDLDEEGSDYDYSDMMFILNVVPADTTETTIILGDNSENSKFIQWWELPTDAGLTGGKSQTPLSSTETPESRGIDNRNERTANNYGSLVGANDVTATSLIDAATGLDVKYLRIKFDGAGQIVRPDDYRPGEVIYYHRAKVSAVSGDASDPDKYDDIFEFVSQELQQPAAKREYEDCSTDLERKDRGFARLLDQAAAKGLTLADIDTRGAEDEKTIAAMPEDPEFEDRDENYLYNIREERYTARRQAGLSFGGGGAPVAVGKTDAALNRERGDDGDAAPASREQHLFLAGEVMPRQYEGHAPEPREVLHRVMLQPEKSYVPDRFVNGGALDRFADYGAFDAKGPRSEAVAEITLRSLEQNSLPSLFLSAKKNGAGFDTAPVMDLVYSGMLPEAEMEDIRDLLRIDEERLALGWHRGGTGADLSTYHLQDSYVAAMLTGDAMQPYTLANPAAGDEGDVVAKIRHEAVSGGDAIVTHLVNIDAGERLPTFVFDKPFDGAGVLVINGNLHVKSTFAYYGLVIVMGDIVIEPAEAGYWRKDAAGNFIDANGNRIYWDGARREWFRLEDNVHDDGTEYKTRVPADEPEKVPQYKGEMMVQGRLLVGGDTEVRYVSVTETVETRESRKGGTESDRVVTVTVGSNDNTQNRVNPDLDSGGTDDNGNDQKPNTGRNNMSAYERTTTNTVHSGKFIVVASDAANQMVADNFRDENGGVIGRFLMNRPVWNTNSDDDVGHLWTDAVEQ